MAVSQSFALQEDNSWVDPTGVGEGISENEGQRETDKKKEDNTIPIDARAQLTDG